jgi:hypothetical protein
MLILTLKKHIFLSGYLFDENLSRQGGIVEIKSEAGYNTVVV